MSGSFEDLDVPPTLVSFAVTTDQVGRYCSPLSSKGRAILWFGSARSTVPDGLPVAASLKKVYQSVNRLMKKGKVLAAYTATFGGVAEAVLKMALGNGIGFRFDEGCTLDELFAYSYGSFVLELTEQEEIGLPLGVTTEEAELYLAGGEHPARRTPGGL